jgi:hypothetical protein
LHANSCDKHRASSSPSYDGAGRRAASAERGCDDGPVVALANPGAGELLNSGDVIIKGLAYDPRRDAGSWR